MLKSFPGEAPELDSLNAQRGRSQTKTAPGCRVFRYWMDKPRTKGYDRRANSGRRQRSPVGAGDCPEGKQKRRIPMPKTFPGESLRKYFSHSCRALFNKMGKFFTNLSRFNNFYQPVFRAFFSKKRETRKKHGFFICIFLPNPSFPTVCRGLPQSIHGQK